MKYLTRSYVEHLGLQEVPVLTGFTTAGWVSELAEKPVTREYVARGVLFDDGLYLKSSCGLSYDLQHRREVDDLAAVL